MSTQIAIRLPDDMVAFIDELVRSGDARSRAAVVSRALDRERRRKIAERDVAILRGQQPDADLDGLAQFGSAVAFEDLD
jgi:Arc/MetJ-type ribon-helix-helix transcriptional regulator